jgi:nucleoside-diphosphate-sugar epimerase
VALSRGAEERAPEGARAIAVDLVDPDATGAAVRDAAPDVVFHLAALASVAESWEHPRRVLGENLLATLNLLETVRAEASRARVLVVSTGEV